MKMNHILFLLTAAFCFPSITVAKIIEAGSPDKKNVITIETDNQVNYSLSRNGTKILDTCPLSLTVGNDTWGTDKCRKITRKSVSEKWNLLYRVNIKRQWIIITRLSLFTKTIKSNSESIMTEWPIVS